MKPIEILEELGNVEDRYIWDAQQVRGGETSGKRHIPMKRLWFLAAIVAVMLLLAGCVAYTQGWFVDFFSGRGAQPLSDSQIQWLREQEQPIRDAQSHHGWTVELRAAINDGTTGYIILRVTAPEGISLEEHIMEAYDRIGSRVYPGNTGWIGRENGSKIVVAPSGVVPERYTFGWEEDGDGKENTRNYVIQFQPDIVRSTVEPFGPDAQWHVNMVDFYRESTDEDYYTSLMEGKYQGADAIMFTEEETARMSQTERLAEGDWAFSFCFDQSGPGIELLEQPLSVQTMAREQEIPERENIPTDVTITSFVLRSLGATVICESAENSGFLMGNDCVHVRMKDGTQVALVSYAGTGGIHILEAKAPIVLSEVDSIRFPDGTQLPMPQ